MNTRLTRNSIELPAHESAKPMCNVLGGRGFHCLDPNGNERAVWSEA